MLTDLLDRLRREREEARAIAELRAMSAHELADLGISRDQIRPYVKGRVAPRSVRS